MDILHADTELPAATRWLANTDDVLAAELDRDTPLALQFPQWTDGRAYSQAALLRGRLRHTGRIVAVGDIVFDMLPLLQRCGFDAARLRPGQDPAHARRALGFVGVRYQRSAAERVADR